MSAPVIARLICENGHAHLVRSSMEKDTGCWVNSPDACPTCGGEWTEEGDKPSREEVGADDEGEMEPGEDWDDYDEGGCRRP